MQTKKNFFFAVAIFLIIALSGSLMWGAIFRCPTSPESECRGSCECEGTYYWQEAQCCFKCTEGGSDPWHWCCGEGECYVYEI